MSRGRNKKTRNWLHNPFGIGQNYSFNLICKSKFNLLSYNKVFKYKRGIENVFVTRRKNPKV